MTCACGHADDEHDDMGECQAEGCPCFYFDATEFEEDE